MKLLPAKRLSLLTILAALLISGFVVGTPNHNFTAPPSCETPGWFPVEFGLRDHNVFLYDGFYYLISTYYSYSNPSGEDRFAYARSTDLCNWDRLGDVLSERVPGAPDEFRVWAPHVYQKDSTFYLFYTGVTTEYTQRILLATSTDPADPLAWHVQGVVFEPGHPGMVWQAGEWADCRDPAVIRVDQTYYLYYTGRDSGGGIIGVATADNPDGPWIDQGAIFPPLTSGMPESPTLVQYGGRLYLFYQHTGVGEVYRIGDGPIGPWNAAAGIRPGWAHEVWQGTEGDWYASYLTDYTVSIAPLTWLSFAEPPAPWIGPLNLNYLPIATK